LDLFSTIQQLAKGHPITIGQILADFVASCKGKIIVEIMTQILISSRKNFPGWAEEMS
jgi:hypothetical protein